MKVGLLETNHGLQLAWLDEEWGDGARVGETRHRGAPKAGASDDDREIWAADEAARPFAEDGSGPPNGYTFASQSQAAKALRAVRAALRALAAEKKGKPWPEWAKAAAAAGWKPPKGWAP